MGFDQPGSPSLSSMASDSLKMPFKRDSGTPPRRSTTYSFVMKSVVWNDWYEISLKT